jgi:hypothetical protein
MIKEKRINGILKGPRPLSEVWGRAPWFDRAV